MGEQNTSARYIQAYRALGAYTAETVYPILLGYIRDRFLLTPEMCAGDDLLELADISLRHILELKKQGLYHGDISRSCSGASSVISKKVLLMKAVQEDFGVSMTPEEFAGIATVRDLAAFLSRRQTAPAAPVVPSPAAPETDFDVYGIRGDFPALLETVHGHPLIYLDHAATAQMPRAVLEAVQETERCRGNVHRGIHSLSNRCTDAYEEARRVCAAFLGAAPDQITFTAGATDGINRVAGGIFRQCEGGVVVTALEHHSNFVPWQQLCLARGRPFRVCPILPEGALDLERLDRLLTEDISLLAVTQCSNVLGTVTPVREICRLAHARGIRVLVDGAQSVCHMDIDVKALDCDFFVCSGHKLGAPFGIGLLYCKKPLPPAVFGGGMVDTVTQTQTTFLPTLEAGTPNVSGAVGLAAAIRYRQTLPRGWQKHEQLLLRRTETLLSKIPGVHILGSGPRTGCLSVTLDGISALDAAALLDQAGIALRSGSHCAQPLMAALGLKDTLRVSLGFYNTLAELETFASELRRLLAMKPYQP